MKRKVERLVKDLQGAEKDKTLDATLVATAISLRKGAALAFDVIRMAKLPGFSSPEFGKVVC